jgi:hypothetical protein
MDRQETAAGLKAFGISSERQRGALPSNQPVLKVMLPSVEPTTLVIAPMTAVITFTRSVIDRIGQGIIVEADRRQRNDRRQ